MGDDFLKRYNVVIDFKNRVVELINQKRTVRVVFVSKSKRGKKVNGS